MKESVGEIPFELFEKALMQKLLERDTSINKVLRKQYENATVIKRTFTGAGFFTDFYVPENVPPVTEPIQYGYGDVNFTINGIENFGGCVLFVRNGIMICLEGYTFMDEWPKIITSYELKESTIGYEPPQY